MQLTPEQIQIGSENFNRVSNGLNDSSVSRRDFIKAAAAGTVGLGAAYFGYKKLEGDAVRVGFIGTGDEGNILLTQHPPEYMNIVAIADIRPSNRLRAFVGDGNDDRMGLIRKLGESTASKIKAYNDHRELLADKNIEAVVIAVPLNQHGPLVMEALDAGKHVLTEKLMAHDITQCKQMIRKAKEKNLHLAVGHQRHYSVLYDNANHIVREGLLGDVKFIRAPMAPEQQLPRPRQLAEADSRRRSRRAGKPHQGVRFRLHGAAHQLAALQRNGRRTDGRIRQPSNGRLQASSWARSIRWPSRATAARTSTASKASARRTSSKTIARSTTTST